MFDSAQKKIKEIVYEIYNNSPRKTKYINGHSREHPSYVCPEFVWASAMSQIASASLLHLGLVWVMYDKKNFVLRDLAA